MTNIPGEAVLADTEFPGWVIDQTRDIGGMGGAGEPAINLGAQTFVLYLAPTNGVIFDQVRISHEGVTPGGINQVEFDIYRVPKGVTIAAGLVAANRIAEQIKALGSAVAELEFDFKTSLVSRRFSQGDRLVLQAASLLDQSSSSSSAVDQTLIAEVSVSILGRLKIG